MLYTYMYPDSNNALAVCQQTQSWRCSKISSATSSLSFNSTICHKTMIADWTLYATTHYGSKYVVNIE